MPTPYKSSVKKLRTISYKQGRLGQAFIYKTYARSASTFRRLMYDTTATATQPPVRRRQAIATMEESRVVSR
jgi:hypothetical protein